MHSRKLYCTTGNFTTQQKSQFRGRNQRKVPTTAETEDKPTLQCLPLYLDSTFAHKLATAKWYFEAHSVECQARLPSQKKKRKKNPLQWASEPLFLPSRFNDFQPSTNFSLPILLGFFLLLGLKMSINNLILIHPTLLLL